MKVFGIINEEKFKGYSNSVKSLLNEVNGAKEIIDTNNTTIDEIKDSIANSAHTQKTLVVSAADMGANMFETLNDNPKAKYNVEYALASDRYYDFNAQNINTLSLIMPENAINKYKDTARTIKTIFKSYPADLVASPTKEDMQNRASDFANLNYLLTSKIRDLIISGAKTFFIGGRVALSDGTFKENTPEIFAKAGEMVASHAPNGAIIVFHGLRSFTRGDKTNDFAPYNAFRDALQKNMPYNKEFVLLTKELDEEGKRKSVAKVISKSKKDSHDMDYDYKDITYPITESKFGAADYYFLLNEAVKAGLPLTATIEQMNFIPEALTLGAKPSDLLPYKWALSVESNLKTYEKLFAEYYKNGRILDTQVSAFKKLLSEMETSEKLLLNKIQNVR